MTAPGTAAPPCKCHGEAQYWKSDDRYRAGGYFRCAVRNREQHRDRYAELDGVAYNALLLRHRRNKAMARMHRRHEGANA